MKKKILFMLINMNVGGTEKALLNMVAEFPKDKYEITILMLEKYGGFLDLIPGGVKVQYLHGYEKIKSMLNKPPQLVVMDYIKSGKMLKAFNILILYLVSKAIKDRSFFLKYILKDYPVNNFEYDVAVAYAGPMELITYYVLNKITARKKIQWIHFDVTKIGFNPNFASKTFNKFDKIFVVSKEGKKQLINILPMIKDKADNFPNIISPKTVIKMGNEGNGFEDNFGGVRILTVGRLSREKGQDLTIPVLAKLKADGHKVRWYCIGDGGARTEYEQLIQKYQVEHDYIFLGNNPNPYPFLKQCDIYVQPSRHEGYCITLAEARCFNKPIITTNFAGAKEQIKNGITGLIVDSDTEEIYEAVSRLLNNKNLCANLSNNLGKENIDTTTEMKKIYYLATDNT